MNTELVNSVAEQLRTPIDARKRARLEKELFDLLRPVFTAVARKQIRRSRGRVDAMVLDDLVSEGMALMVACLADHDGTKDFGAYVVRSFKNQVFTLYHKHTEPVALNRAELRVARQAHGAAGELMARTGRSATVADIRDSVLDSNRRRAVGVDDGVPLTEAQIKQADTMLRRRGTLAAIGVIGSLLNVGVADIDMGTMGEGGDQQADGLGALTRLIDDLGPVAAAALSSLWGLDGGRRKGRRAASAETGMAAADVIAVANLVEQRAKSPVAHYALFSDRIGSAPAGDEASPARLLAPVC